MIEFSPSRSVKNDNRFVEEREKLEEKRQKIREYLLTISEQKDEQFSTIEASCKQSIIDLHKNLEIDLVESDFPPVYVIDRIKHPEVFKMLEYEDESESAFHSPTFNCILLFETKPIRQAHILYHEFMHAIGRSILTVFRESPESDNIVFSAQTGLRTLAPSKRTRGQLMEEAVVDYFAIKFVREFKDEHLQNIRNNFLLEKKPELHPLVATNNTKIIDLFLEPLLEKENQGVYIESLKFIRKIVKDLGEDFLFQLLKSRVKPQNRKQISKQLDDKYGKGMAKRIFSTPFHPQLIQLLMDLMVPLKK